MCTNIKTLNEKELWLKILVDSGCIYTGIDKQLVKEERIKIEPKIKKLQDSYHWNWKLMDI